MALLKLRNFYDNDFDLFDEFIRNTAENSLNAEGKSFPVDIHEQDKNFSIVAELSGVSDEDLEITLDDNILTIKAEKEVKNKDKNYCRKEINSGKMERKFKLPNSINKDDIEADLNNGLLEITLPKKENTYKKIDITTN